jgi:hypothetical protein
VFPALSRAVTVITLDPLASAIVKLRLALVPLTEALPEPPRLLVQEICDRPTLSVAVLDTVTLELEAV